eukprot:3465283-Amphidinium_carterae.1
MVATKPICNRTRNDGQHNCESVNLVPRAPVGKAAAGEDALVNATVCDGYNIGQCTLAMERT